MSYVGNAPAAGILSGENIQDGGIQTVDLANGAVTPAKLSSGAPTWTAGGNLGIGTSSPGYKLDVNGGIRTQGWGSSATAGNIAWGTSATAAQIFGNESIMALFTNGSERMRIDASGNLGVGTSSPAQRLDVVGGYIRQQTQSNSVTGNCTTFFTNSSSTVDFGTYIEHINNSVVDARVTIGGKETVGTITFGTNTAGSAATERMRIDAFGNVGIGTSSPASAYRLDVAGHMRLQNSFGYSFIQYGSDAIAADNWHVGSEGDGSFRWYIGNFGAGTERMRIDSSGNLLVGTTNGAYQLTTNSTTYNAAMLGILTTGRSGTEYPSVGYNVRYTSTFNNYTYNGTDTASMIKFQSGQVQTFTAGNGTSGTAISFTQGPYVTNGGTSWTNGSSDVRLKKNFETSQGLAEILQIEPVKYHFLTDDDNSTKRLGFKAQNLLPVIPEMVVEKDDLAEDGTPYLTITPDYLLPVLVKAIQEQQALIVQLQADVATLKGAN